MPPSPGALPSRPLQWMVGHPAAKGHSIFSTSLFLLLFGLSGKDQLSKKSFPGSIAFEATFAPCGGGWQR